MQNQIHALTFDDVREIRLDGGDLGCAICGRDRPEQVILKVEIATDGGDINDNYAHVSCILLDLKELMDSLDEDFLLSNLEG